MSFKIYDAYKVRRRDQLWPLLREIQETGRANVIKRLKEIYWKQMVFLDTESAEFKEVRANYEEEWPARLRIVHGKMWDEFQTHATDRTRGEYDLEVSVSVYEHPSGFYIRTSCDNVSCLRGCLDFIHTHSKVRDFHFQNSSGRPRSASARDWMTRRRVWDQMLDQNGVLRPIAVVPICDWQSYWLLDPHLDLARKYRDKPPKFPILEEAYAAKLRKIPELGTVIAAKGVIQAEPSGMRIRQGKKVWTSSFKGKQIKRHPNLGAAIEHVKFLYLPPEMKAIIERMMKHAKRKRS